MNNTSTDTSTIPETSGPKTLVSSFLRWIKRNKILSVVAVLLLFVGIEFITLPSSAAIERLRKENPQRTALMEARANEAKKAGRKFVMQQQWVSLSRISQDAVHAVIVAEDGAFYDHEGIDWFEVKESIKKDFEKMKLARGGSTITQQLAKNLYLSTSKDPIRKLKEIMIAKRLEDELTKERILELYLNIIEWGDGIFGIETASLGYFGKHASELGRDEAARLAAVIPSPRKHNPTNDSRYVNYRKKIVLMRMEARGW